MQPNLLTSPAIPNIAYDYKQGMFFRIKQEGDTFVIIRRLLPDEEGYIFGTDPYGKVIKRKGSTLAWVLGYNLDVPEGCVVLQPTESLELSALHLVSKEDYYKYKDAEYNLSNGVQVIQDETTCLFILRYRERNRQIVIKGYGYSEALRIKEYILSTALELVNSYR